MLQIIHISTAGGAEKHTRLITKAFARCGLHVTIVYPPGDYACEFAALSSYGVDCIEFDIKRNVAASILFLRNLIKQKNINLIHSHMLGADLLAMCACAGMRNVRHFTTIHNLPQDKFGFWYRLRCTILTIISYHAMAKIFAVSKPVARRARRSLFLSKDKVAVTLNSIDFSEMTVSNEEAEKLKHRLSPSGDAKILLCAGILFSRKKGQEFIIRALHRLKGTQPQLKLVLLGTGEGEHDLRELVRKLKLESLVEFPGYQPNICDWLSVADIYIQPSIFDPLPRALLEAMYMKRPVIASDIDTMRQVVCDKENGLLVPVRSSDAIADAIEYILQNREHALRMAENAHAFVRDNCSMDTMARTTLTALGIKVYNSHGPTA